MKKEELVALGITEDVAAKVLEMNGKDIEHAKGVITTAKDKTISDLTTERDDFKTRLTNAEETLKSFEGIDPQKIQQEIQDYKKRAEDAEADFAKKMTARDQRDWIKTKLDEYGVASPYARKQRQSELTGEIQRTNESIRQTQIEEERVKEQMSKATVALDKFTKRIIGLAKRVFVFTLITKALRNVRAYFSQALNASDGFRESVANLKGALLVAFQPLMNLVIPAITAFIGLAAKAANMLAHLAQWFGGLFGKNSRDAAKAMYEQAKATAEAGDAAEKAKRQMSGLDEMNTWQL